MESMQCPLTCIFEVYCVYNFKERSNVSLVFSKPLAKIEITCPKEIHLFFPVFDCFGIFFYVYIEIWVLFHQWWLTVQGNNSCNLPIFRWLFFGIEYVLIKWKNISDIFAILKQQKVISKGTDKYMLLYHNILRNILIIMKWLMILIDE